MNRIAYLLAVLLALPFLTGAGSKKGGGGLGYITSVQANMPTSPTCGAAGALFMVTNGADDADCDPTSGTGAVMVLCMCNGTNWEAVGDSGTGAGDELTVNSAAMTAPNLLDGDIDFVVAGQNITATYNASSIDTTDIAADGVGTSDVDGGGTDASATLEWIKVDPNDTSQFIYLNESDFRTAHDPDIADLAANSFSGNQCGGDAGSGDVTDDCSDPTWSITATGIGTFENRVAADEFDLWTGSNAHMAFGENVTPTYFQFKSTAGYVGLEGEVWIQEQAAPEAAVSGYGSFWVDNATNPSRPMFRDESGADLNLSPGGGVVLSSVSDPTADAAWTFDQGEELTFNFDTDTAGTQSFITIDADWTSAATTQTVMNISIDLEGAAGSPQGILINNLASAANRSLAKALVINHGEDTGVMTSAISIEGSTADKITTAVDLSSSGIATALALGSNDVTVGGVTIDSTEFSLLNGKTTALVDTNDSVTWTVGPHDFGDVQLQVTNSTAAPSAGDCDNDAEAGRVHVDTSAQDGLFYVCNGEAVGWVGISGLQSADSPWVDTGNTILVDTTDNVHIGDGADGITGKLEIGGDADEAQLVIEGYSSQSVQPDLVVIQNDANDDLVTISNAGVIKAQSIIDIDGTTAWEVQADGDAEFKSVTVDPDGTPTVTFRDSNTDVSAVDVDATIGVNATATGANVEDSQMTFNLLVDGGTDDAGALTTLLTLQGEDVASGGSYASLAAPLIINGTGSADPADAGTIRFDNNEGLQWEASPAQADTGLEPAIVVNSAENLFLSNINAIDLGVSGVRIAQDGDGAVTFTGLGDGSDEDLKINLDDTSNTVSLTSSTGVTTIDAGTIGILTTGSIKGAAPIVSQTTGNIAINTVTMATGAGDYNLPTDQCDTATGYWFMLIVRDAAETVSLTSNDASDLFVYKGIATLIANDELDSPGAAQDSVSGICLEANKWYITSNSGDWVDGGTAD